MKHLSRHRRSHGKRHVVLSYLFFRFLRKNVCRRLQRCRLGLKALVIEQFPLGKRESFPSLMWFVPRISDLATTAGCAKTVKQMNEALRSQPGCGEPHCEFGGDFDPVGRGCGRTVCVSGGISPASGYHEQETWHAEPTMMVNIQTLDEFLSFAERWTWVWRWTKTSTTFWWPGQIHVSSTETVEAQCIA